MRRGVLAVLWCVGLAACEPAGVQLQLGQDGYAAGQSAQLRLFNGSEARVEYNLCVTALERQAGEGWVRLAWEDWHAPNTACTMEALTLAPGQRSAPYALALPEGLSVGTYRFVASVSDDAGVRREAASEPFRLTRP